MSTQKSNIDSQETAKFDAMAAQWWDPDGDCRALHDINSPRVNWIMGHQDVVSARVLDVGCGGGLLSEALARAGARVTGIDMAKRALQVAQMHAQASELEIDYQLISAESLAQSSPESFDAVCCLELLEHVPKPRSLISACSALVAPGGGVFFSTINRHPLAWAGAIVGAEQLLGLLPKGTHQYERFIKPSELAALCRETGLWVKEIVGLHYNPWSRSVRIGGRPWVNYFLYAQKPHV